MVEWMDGKKNPAPVDGWFTTSNLVQDFFQKDELSWFGVATKNIVDWLQSSAPVYDLLDILDAVMIYVSNKSSKNQ